MADIMKRLYQGQLPSTAATLYTAPAVAGNVTIIREMSIVNNNTTAETIELFVQGTAEANKILSVTLEAGESGDWGGTMILEDSETLAGGTTTASEVTLTVYGMERT